MAKYTEELAQEIAQELATGKHTLKEVIKAKDLHHSTHYDWMEKKPEYSDLIKAALKNRRKNLAERAASGLYKLVDSHEYEEEETTYDLVEVKTEKPNGDVIITQELKPVSKKIKKKVHAPNMAAIAFVKTNVEPENWKHVQHIDHTTKGESIIDDTTGMTTEELIERAKAIERFEKAKASQET